MTCHLRVVAALAAALTLSACSSAQEPGQPAADSASTTTPPAPGAIPAPATSTPLPDVATWTPEPAPTGAQGQPRGLPVVVQDVDGSDVDAVAQAFALAMLTPDTDLDLTPVDTVRRAAPLMTDEYAATMTQDRPGGGGAEWITLSKNRGYIDARLQDTAATDQGLITAPADAELFAERPYIAVTTPQDADLPEQSLGVVVYLSRTAPDQPWRVYDYYQEGFYE